MSKPRPASTKGSNQGVAARLNSLKPAQIFFLNVAVLGLSILLLGVTLCVQYRDHHVPGSFQGYQRGVAVSRGNSVMRIDSVTSSNGISYFSAPPNKHYLIVSLTVKNVSGKPINVFPSSDTYVKDPAGHVTYLTPYNLTQPFRAGELLPGEQIKGQLSYLVPKRGSQKLYIDAIWSGGAVPFVIQ